MKTFIQHDIPKLNRIDGPSGRLYETPTGKKYPSVTTVVGLTKQKFIHQWRQRVGEEEANKISSRASRRGTAVHTLCEQYLLGESAAPNMFDAEMFSKMRPHLDAIDNIHCLETQLFSHRLEVAGTVDCIAEYNGQLAVIDFKTSKRPKTEDEITDYFMQTAAYSFMFWERTKLAVKKTVIVMGVDDSDALVFEQPAGPWLREFIKVRDHYKEMVGV